MTAITIERLTKRFGSTAAVNEMSLELPAGSFTALLGPSGCGKSTLLRLIAGFEQPDEGAVLFDGRVVAAPETNLAPEKRNVGVVFQSYALWPHMDVAGNVGYPLRTRGVGKAEAATRIETALATVGLSNFGSRQVDELSGGQRQRVALARCLIANNPVILFDEPLANLDMHLRAAMIETFRDIARRTRATIVYVTHDQAEALALADRIAVVDNGRLQQVASPADVYDSPANEMVARFVGRGSILNAQIAADESGDLTARIGDWRFPVRGGASGPSGRVLLRPEALGLAGEGLPATVLSTTYRGPVHEVKLALASGGEVSFDARLPPKAGDKVRIAVNDAWIVPG
jgi:iron(III) transport system ATP-binding protein